MTPSFQGKLISVLALAVTLAMVVLMLFSEIELTAVNDELWRSEQNCRALRRETLTLRARAEQELSLEELERLAVTRLGMSHPTA